MSKPKKYFIVWNSTKTEGFITDDPGDAVAAATGFSGTGITSTVGDAFYEAYGDDGEAELSMQEVELP